MKGVRFIRTIRLENILSYGPSAAEFPLEPLNVLIGPNASGKSNLIDALSLLAAAPRDIQVPIRAGGGVHEWLWKGEVGPDAETNDFILALNEILQIGHTATVDVTVEYPKGIIMPLRYRLSFNQSELGTRFDLRDEAVENEHPQTADHEEPYFYYRYQNGNPVINVGQHVGEPRSARRLAREDVKHDQSILSQRRDRDFYPELTYLAERFEKMGFYREFQLGRRTPMRVSQPADLVQDYLLEDASNLALVLSDLLNQPLVKRQILDRLRVFYPSFNDVRIDVSGGKVQIYFEEHGLRKSVPALRLSDGSLRYLCLLAVLCHPSPPLVVCIEEPELGLHPDMIPEVAKLLIEASSRCQIFVTTHSDILVDALSEVPESVVVCEKFDGATQLRRLNADELKPWLENYRLGELWTRGEIGGNRW